jgi:hypothetical protein
MEDHGRETGMTEGIHARFEKRIAADMAAREDRAMRNANPVREVGLGGAPTRATTFPHDAQGRKQRPVASGVLDYFPDALVAVAEVSFRGNEQHNPGEPLHWARGKSMDEADAMIRHFLQRGKWDVEKDGSRIRHSAKMVWRALALLQKEIEAEAGQWQATPEKSLERVYEENRKAVMECSPKPVDPPVDPHGPGRMAPRYQNIVRLPATREQQAAADRVIDETGRVIKDRYAMIEDLTPDARYESPVAPARTTPGKGSLR